MHMEPSIDLSTFLDVSAPHTSQPIYRLTLSKVDQLSQNNAFCQATKDVADFHLRLSPDGRTIALSQEEPHNLTFTPAGVRTHHPLGNMLRQLGLELPVSYRMVWREDLNCWLGQYDGLCTPPPVKKLADSAKKRQRGA